MANERQGYADLIKKASAVIFSLDLSGCVSAWNEAAARITGKSQGDQIGARLASQIESPESRKALEDALAQIAEGKAQEPFELILGRETTIMVGLSPQLGPTGVVGAFCVGQVVPKAAARGGMLMGTSNKNKGLVMHELRSPLHGIVGLANTLSQDESPLQKPLRMIGESADRVLELVTNLMDFWSLSEDPAGDNLNDAINMGTLMEEAAGRCLQAKDKRGKPLKKDKVNLTQEIASNLPPILGNHAGVSQMMYHLAMNAFKFTREGEVNLSVSQDEITKSIIIRVQDTGIGIAKKNWDMIFKDFAQEDSSESRKYDGIGLGLAIVREVVRIHGGSVTVDSLQGRGSTFTVSLPYERAAPAPVPAPAPAPAPTPAVTAQGQGSAGPKQQIIGPAALTGMRSSEQLAGGGGTPISVNSQASKAAKEVLASAVAEFPPVLSDGRPTVIMSVDDDYVNQEVMRSVLEPCGFKLIVCMSGNECLEHMKQYGATMPDLILLDLMMPGLNGFDVLQVQRTTHSMELVPIIIVSAKNQATSVVKGLELGCNDWIHKPFDRQELISRVKTHLLLSRIALYYRSRLFAAQRLLSPEDAEAFAADISKFQMSMCNSAPEEASTVIVKGAGPMNVQAFETAKPEKDFTETDTTALFVAVAPQKEGSIVPPRVFEILDNLCHRFDITKAEGSYLVMIKSKGDRQRNDKALSLAEKVEMAIKQLNSEQLAWGPVTFRIGLGTSAKEAQELARMTAPNTTLASPSVRSDARSQLYTGEATDADRSVNAEAQGSQTSTRATLPTMSMAWDGAPSEYGLSDRAATKKYEKELGLLRDQMARLQEDLTKEQSEKSQLAKRVKELDQALEQVAEPPGSVGAPVEGVASLRFMQWQNGHLQAELRYSQQELSSAKGELQKLQSAAVESERHENILIERLEHMELELGIKEACNGHLDMSMVSGTYAPPWAAGVSGAYSFNSAWPGPPAGMWSADLGGAAGSFPYAASAQVSRTQSFHEAPTVVGRGGTGSAATNGVAMHPPWPTATGIPGPPWPSAPAPAPVPTQAPAGAGVDRSERLGHGKAWPGLRASTGPGSASANGRERPSIQRERFERGYLGPQISTA